MSDEQQMVIVNNLFPVGEQKLAFDLEDTDDHIPEFSENELLHAVSRIKNKKAAGPDKLSPEIIKAVVLEDPILILKMMNNLLRDRSFPTGWKVAKVSLLSKSQGTEETPKFRPICLLNVMGKLFEHLIAARLTEELENKGLLYEHQYGFRRNRSTVDAMQVVVNVVNNLKMKAAQNREYCLLVTLDIRNAFNTASWRGIMSDLKTKGISWY